MNFIPNFGPDKSTKDGFTKIGDELESLSNEIDYMSGFNADFKPGKDTKEGLKNAEDELTSLDHEKKVMEVLLGYGLIGRDEQIDLDALFKKQKSITQKYVYVSDEAAATSAWSACATRPMRSLGGSAKVDQTMGHGSTRCGWAGPGRAMRNFGRRAARWSWCLTQGTLSH
jgi:hypothetical protein